MKSVRSWRCLVRLNTTQSQPGTRCMSTKHHDKHQCLFFAFAPLLWIRGQPKSFRHFTQTNLCGNNSKKTALNNCRFIFSIGCEQLLFLDIMLWTYIYRNVRRRMRLTRAAINFDTSSQLYAKRSFVDIDQGSEGNLPHWGWIITLTHLLHIECEGHVYYASG